MDSCAAAEARHSDEAAPGLCVRAHGLGVPLCICGVYRTGLMVVGEWSPIPHIRQQRSYEVAVLVGSGQVTHGLLVLRPHERNLEDRSQAAHQHRSFGTARSEPVGTLRELRRRPMIGIRG